MISGGNIYKHQNLNKSKMVTKQEIEAKLIKAREPIKKMESEETKPEEEVKEEAPTEEAPTEEAPAKEEAE